MAVNTLTVVGNSADWGAAPRKNIEVRAVANAQALRIGDTVVADTPKTRTANDGSWSLELVHEAGVQYRIRGALGSQWVDAVLVCDDHAVDSTVQYGSLPLYDPSSPLPTIPTVPSGGGSGGGAVDSVNGRTGAVTLGKSDVGLSNVDNTSDANKPVSTATSTALAGKASTSHTHTASQVSDSTTVGRALLTAVDAAAARSAIGAGASGFSGAYADLTGKPTLGTAASTDATAYATAAQGVKADSAVQPAALTSEATARATGDADTLAAAQAYADSLGGGGSSIPPWLAQYGAVASSWLPGPLTQGSSVPDLFLARVAVPAGSPISGVACYVQTAQTAAGGTNVQYGIWSDAGTLVASSTSDVALLGAAAQWAHKALSSPVAAESTDRFVWVGLLAPTLTTAAILYIGNQVANGGTVAEAFVGGTGLPAAHRRAIVGTASSLPATFDPATYGSSSAFVPVFLLT